MDDLRTEIKMKDLKFITAGEYMKQEEEHREPPEACYIIEGDWAENTEEKNERTMGREIQTKNN